MAVLKYDSIREYLSQEVPDFGLFLESDAETNKKLSQSEVVEEFTRFTISSYVEGKENIGRRHTFRQAVAAIQKMLLSKDEQIRNLVYLSFLENLHTAEEYYKFIIPELTPELQNALKETEKFQDNLQK